MFESMAVEHDLALLQRYALEKAQIAARSRDRIPLVELAQAIHLRVDDVISAIQSTNPTAACCQGCTHCCQGLIPATIPELLEVLDIVGVWSETQKASLRERLNQYHRHSEEYWRYDLHLFSEPCPLLVEGSCTIYAQRPLFCRGKSSYDPQDCIKQAHGEMVPLKIVPGQYEAGSFCVGAIVQGIKQSGRYSGTYDFAAALKILIENPQAADDLARGVVNPLNKVMIGSDANVKRKPLSEPARRFFMPDLAECFRPGLDAEQQYRASIRVASKNPYATLGQLVLPKSYGSQNEIEDWWRRYESAVSRLEQLELDPQVAFEAIDLGGVYVFGLPYCGKDVRPVMERVGNIVHGYASRGYPALTSPIETNRRPGKFRLGYVSRNLKYNNGSRWALGWATEHSNEIETYAFNLSETDDNVSTRWRRTVAHYYHLPVPPIEAAQMIRSLDLDALIFTDVGTDGTSVQLSSLRIARYQLAAWGFPMTTGSPEMDFYISSEEMEPASGQDHYRERLLLLPGSGQTFPKARRSQPSGHSATELGLPEDGFILIAQNPIKLLPKRDAIFREISERLGKPIVICDSSDHIVGDRVAARMKQAKINVVKLPFVSDSEFLRVIQLATVVLDSFDFGGGFTTVDALTLKRPPVCCPGEFLRGRFCIPFMRQAGVSDMLMESAKAYISQACDLEKIAESAERCNPEPIYRDLRPVRALERFLLALPLS
jgi:hypothetical protein